MTSEKNYITDDKIKWSVQYQLHPAPVGYIEVSADSRHEAERIAAELLEQLMDEDPEVILLNMVTGLEGDWEGEIEVQDAIANS